MDKKRIWFLMMIMGMLLAACAPKAPGITTPGGVGTAPQVTAPSAIQHFEMVPPEAESLCEAAFTSPVISGSAPTPLRTLVNKDYEAEGWVFDPNTMLIPFKEPLKTSEILSLVCIRESRTQETTYADGEPGYRVIWDTRLVLYPQGGVVAKGKFEGGPPPDTEMWESRKKYESPPWYGDPPEGGLIKWLFPYTGERTVFCNVTPAYDIALSPDGKLLAAGGHGNIVRIWDMTTGEALRPLTLVEDTVYVGFLAFSPDGKALALPGELLVPLNQPVQLWDVASGELLPGFNTEEYMSIMSVAFSPDGRLLAAGNWDGAVYLWDVASGQVIRTLSAHPDMVNSLAFSPDGKLLASGSYDGTVVLWDAASGQPLQTISAHAGSVNSVAFSPDGKTLASGGDDNSAKLWDVASGQLLRTLGGEDSMTSVAFSPDGRILASAEVLDVKLWDVGTWEVLRTLEGHVKSVTRLVFSPDGKSLYSGSIDTTIKRWDVSTGQ